MKKETITIAAPVRNREWILDQYLLKIENINYDKSLIDLIFIINDSTDDSLHVLQQFKKRLKNEYSSIKIETKNKFIPEDIREVNVRSKYIYQQLSELRNYIISKTKSDYLIFIDTDILVSDDIINNLLKHKKDITAGLIYNGYIASPNKPYLYPNIMRLHNNTYEHITNKRVKESCNSAYSTSNLIEVDLTGAVIMISRQVYKEVKYGFHPQGEDAYFCKMAQAKGFKLYCDTGVFCHHIMTKNMLEKYIESKEIYED